MLNFIKAVQDNNAKKKKKWRKRSVFQSSGSICRKRGGKVKHKLLLTTIDVKNNKNVEFLINPGLIN